jgi:hypothetical protein
LTEAKIVVLKPLGGADLGTIAKLVLEETNDSIEVEAESPARDFAN